MQERLTGIGLLLAGVVLSYMCVYEPLESATRQAPKVRLISGAVVCPLAVVMGTAYLILGKRATDVFGTREKPSRVAYVCGFALVLAGLGLYFWLRGALESRGYQF